jgi:hypothetical protein
MVAVIDDCRDYLLGNHDCRGIRRPKPSLTFRTRFAIQLSETDANFPVAFAPCGAPCVRERRVYSERLRGQ